MHLYNTINQRVECRSDPCCYECDLTSSENKCSAHI